MHEKETNNLPHYPSWLKKNQPKDTPSKSRNWIVYNLIKNIIYTPWNIWNCKECIQLNIENCENLNDNKTVTLHTKNVDFNLNETNVVTFSNDYEEASPSMAYDFT